MTPRAKVRRDPAPPPSPFAAVELAELGLAPGDAVRFRRRDGDRWTNATVTRRERDGSVGLHDRKGAARSIAIELIEVRVTGPRGGVTWEPLPERAARTEQLQLVDAPRARPVVASRRPAPERTAPPEQDDGQLSLL